MAHRIWQLKLNKTTENRKSYDKIWKYSRELFCVNIEKKYSFTILKVSIPTLYLQNVQNNYLQINGVSLKPSSFGNNSFNTLFVHEIDSSYQAERENNIKFQWKFREILVPTVEYFEIYLSPRDKSHRKSVRDRKIFGILWYFYRKAFAYFKFCCLFSA